MRDLPAKPGSVQPAQGFAMKWERARGAAARLAEVAAAVGAAPRLVLATDPDREGEAISWHVVQELQAGPAHALLTVPKTTDKASPASVCTSTLQHRRGLFAGCR